MLASTECEIGEAAAQDIYGIQTALEAELSGEKSPGPALAVDVQDN